MSTIIISMLPELGHINSSLKLAKSLLTRGHDVYYLVAGADYKAHIEKQGLRFIALGDGLGNDVFPNALALMAALLEERLHSRQLDQHLTRAVEIFQREIEDLVRDLSPDLFMIDPFTPEIALIAQQVSAPYVFLNNALFNPLDDTPLLDAAPYLYDAPEVILSLQEFEFSEQSGRGKRKRFYVGAEVDLQRNEEPFDCSMIDLDKRLIYCSFGSQSEVYPNMQRFFDTIVAAVGGLPQYQLILATGAKFGHESFKNIPANVLVVKRAPPLQILPRSSVFIMHGGLNM